MSKPIERFIKKQIHDQGGWDRILERLGSGETVADVARSLRKPDGAPPSRNFVSMLLHADDERSQRIKELQRTEAPDALVDHAVHLVDSAAADRDSVNKAKIQAETRIKVAGFLNRERWGERGTNISVTVNQGQLHLSALRHREVLVEARVGDIESGAVRAPETTLSLPQATVEATVIPASSDTIVTPGHQRG